MPKTPHMLTQGLPSHRESSRRGARRLAQRQLCLTDADQVATHRSDPPKRRALRPARLPPPASAGATEITARPSPSPNRSPASAVTPMPPAIADSARHTARPPSETSWALASRRASAAVGQQLVQAPLVRQVGLGDAALDRPQHDLLVLGAVDRRRRRRPPRTRRRPRRGSLRRPPARRRPAGPPRRPPAWGRSGVPCARYRARRCPTPPAAPAPRRPARCLRSPRPARRRRRTSRDCRS